MKTLFPLRFKQCIRSMRNKWSLPTIAFLAAVALAHAMPSIALADQTSISPCVPSVEQRQAYETDGTWSERSAFADELHNDRADTGLIQQALARQQAENGVSTLSVPSNWESGMGTVGNARVLALRVDFPDKKFLETDTLDALQALFDKSPSTTSAGTFPYDSLGAYYQRASYGKLTITGQSVNYTAQYERAHYTNNIALLFEEALSALDATLDYTQFDGNGDGRIDAIYLHFAGGDSGWGSTWWSNEQIYRSDRAFDAMQPWNIVTLSEPSNEARAAQTIIHETGHVLGLPDLYSYASQTGSTAKRSGSLTFDMMDNNTGDHNGFFKWLLGWLDSKAITRIVANENGITVKQGEQIIEQVSSGADEEPAAVERVLSSFTSDEIDQSGGIIVVSNKDEGMFSSYYLLQYDRFAGNQCVGYTTSEGSFQTLPSGFRLFRVQAELTSGGNDFLHTNARGSVNDQLLELVDPDMNLPHVSSGSDIPCAADDYGCMLYQGSTITPETFPSTNFYENAALGFTGLAFSVSDSAATQGRISISHTQTGKPDVVDFTLTSTLQRGIMNKDCVSLKASSAPARAFPQDPEMQPYLLVDGVPYRTTLKISGTDITASFEIDASILRKNSFCELVFPARIFLVSRTSETEEYSPELRIPLEVGALAQLDKTGQYANTEATKGTPSLSDLFTSADGKVRFFQANGDELRLVTVDENESGQALVKTIPGVTLPSASLEANDTTKLSVAPLGGTKAFLSVKKTTDGSDFTGYWIDVEQGAVDAKTVLDSTGSIDIIAVDGTAVQVMRDWTNTFLVALCPQKDGSVAKRYSKTEAKALRWADNKNTAVISMAQGLESPGIVSIISADSLEARLLEGARSYDEAQSKEDVCANIPVKTQVSITSYAMIEDVKLADKGVYVLVGERLEEGSSDVIAENAVIQFDQTGKELRRHTINLPQAATSTINRLTVGAQGAVTVNRTPSFTNKLYADQEAVFLDSTLSKETYLLTSGASRGTWVHGRWLAAGWNTNATGGGSGSPETGANEGDSPENMEAGYLRVQYYLTEELDLATGNGEQPEQPADNAEDQHDRTATALAATGDDASKAYTMFGVVAATTLFMATLSARRSRKEPHL